MSAMFVLAALTACSAPTPDRATPDAAGATAVRSSSAPSPTQAETRLPVGEVAEMTDANGTLTAVALTYTQPVEGPHPSGNGCGRSCP